MKNKYGIGIFILLFLFIYFMSYGAYQEYSNTEEISEPEYPGSKENEFDAQGFYLYEINGFVVVYEKDKKTPFEYTDISYEELPELIKKEIQNGKYLKNEEELYGFLENYTS